MSPLCPRRWIFFGARKGSRKRRLGSARGVTIHCGRPSSIWRRARTRVRSTSRNVSIMGPGDARAFNAWPYRHRAGRWSQTPDPPDVLDYVTDADDTGDLAVAQHRHVSYAVARHQLHHVTDTLVRRHGDHAVSHDFLHRHQSGSLAVARKSVNDFTFGNKTENSLPAYHHESTDVLYAQPVRRSPNAGIRLYCRDVGALLPQNGFNGHSCIS